MTVRAGLIQGGPACVESANDGRSAVTRSSQSPGLDNGRKRSGFALGSGAGDVRARNAEGRRNVVRKYLIAGAVALGLVAQPAVAQVSDEVIKIGVLTDMSSLYSDINGPGAVGGGADGDR